MKEKVVITCEHGGNRIPTDFEVFFQKDAEILTTHRGYDIGALELYYKLVEQVANASFYSETSRLLVELNRSLHSKSLFSSITRELPKHLQQEIIEEHYKPYRTAVEKQILEYIRQGHRVVHLSVHSFTPVLDGEVRNADVGLLYDPQRAGEKQFCEIWKSTIGSCNIKLLVRYNYPYKGTADGFTTYLRQKFSDEQYLGIELEVNQKFPQGEPELWQEVQDCITDSFVAALGKFSR